jgi:hypothetical protein
MFLSFFFFSSVPESTVQLATLEPSVAQVVFNLPVNCQPAIHGSRSHSNARRRFAEAILTASVIPAP